MLKPLILTLAAAALCAPALADCASAEAALRAKAGETKELATKIEAHRELVQATSAKYADVISDDETKLIDEELGTYETELDDLKGARTSALYDILDLKGPYEKACKTPAQPVFDEFGITADDLDLG